MNKGCAAAFVAALAAFACAAEAQEPARLAVDQNDPALQRFRQVRPRTVAAQPKLPQLDIPVLNFVRPPLEGVPAFKEAARSTGRQLVVTDDDRGWYTIRHEYPDVVITITGDQRVQSRSEAPPPAALARPVVIVPASGDERAEAGFVAEITLYRYPNIPYAVTVECTKASAALCTSESALQALVERIDLISVPEQR
jgi:hypothetical protein